MLNPEAVTSRGADATNVDADTEDVYRRGTPVDVRSHMNAKRLPVLSDAKLFMYVRVAPTSAGSDPTTVGTPP
jgi:hypothetical protein